jgi:uncharacterized membrane protein YraQ (UPF0718 family)/YHS domain-containing protein
VRVTFGAVAGRAWHDVVAGCEQAFFMFWQTGWALVLGFALSGAVQAFVSRRELEAKLGNHRPASVLRAAAYGMASSSCSYAASAMAKSLFAKGADFVSSTVFMVASTNLVIDLGVVLWVLIGWQFALAELVGGALMIALLALVGAVAFGRERLEAARRALLATASSPARAAEAHDEPLAWRWRLRSPARWLDAAGYAVADLRMLRREMLVGFVVAGFLAALVPASAWQALFIEHHGAWSVLENAVVGPLLAMVSFVCSIGNVPLAAALWHGGISFGGVVSFLFADLIAVPLVLVYRKFYGTALALRLVGVLWAVTAAGGLATQGLFQAARLIPTTRPLQVVPEQFAFDATTALDIAAIVLFIALVWAARHRVRSEQSERVAIDPICGMQIERASAPATVAHDGRTFFFCSDHCATRFRSDPERFVAAADADHEQPDVVPQLGQT